MMSYNHKIAPQLAFVCNLIIKNQEQRKVSRSFTKFSHSAHTTEVSKVDIDRNLDHCRAQKIYEPPGETIKICRMIE